MQRGQHPVQAVEGMQAPDLGEPDDFHGRAEHRADAGSVPKPVELVLVVE